MKTKTKIHFLVAFLFWFLSFSMHKHYIRVCAHFRKLYKLIAYVCVFAMQTVHLLFRLLCAYTFFRCFLVFTFCFFLLKSYLYRCIAANDSIVFYNVPTRRRKKVRPKKICWKNFHKEQRKHKWKKNKNKITNKAVWDAVLLALLETQMVENFTLSKYI